MKIRSGVSPQAVLLLASSVGMPRRWLTKPPQRSWIDTEFQPSTLSKDDQLKEMQWFIKAAEALRRHGDQRRLRNHHHP